MRRTHTHSYAVMEVSRGTFVEIRTKLEDAGYLQSIHEDAQDDRTTLDMHGIALELEKEPPASAGCEGRVPDAGTPEIGR